VPSVVWPSGHTEQVRLAPALATPVLTLPLSHALQLAPANPGRQSERNTQSKQQWKATCSGGADCKLLATRCGARWLCHRIYDHTSTCAGVVAYTVCVHSDLP
jgi:hypothetical protein